MSSLVWGNHDVSLDGRLPRPTRADRHRPAHLAPLPAHVPARGRLRTRDQGLGACSPKPSMPTTRRTAFRPGATASAMPVWSPACKRPSPSCSANSKARRLPAIRNGKWTTAILLQVPFDEQSSITIDGQAHPVLDTYLPTIDPADPNRLAPEEQECIDRLDRLVHHLAQAVGAHALDGRARAHGDDARQGGYFPRLPAGGRGGPLPAARGRRQGTRGPGGFRRLHAVIKRAFRAGARSVTENDSRLVLLPLGRPALAAFRQGQDGDLRNLFPRDTRPTWKPRTRGSAGSTTTRSATAWRAKWA